MKYLLTESNVAINADQIVKVSYFPALTAEENTEAGIATVSSCFITLAGLNSDPKEYDKVPYPEVVGLFGKRADNFWDVYAGDAFTVKA